MVHRAYLGLLPLPESSQNHPTGSGEEKNKTLLFLNMQYFRVGPLEK